MENVNWLENVANTAITVASVVGLSTLLWTMKRGRRSDVLETLHALRGDVQELRRDVHGIDKRLAVLQALYERFRQ